MTASAPAMPALAAQAGAAVSTAAGQAMVAGGNAAARGSKTASDMYQKHGPQILDIAGGAKDFVAGNGLPPTMPSSLPEALGTGYSIFEHYKNSLQHLPDDWDESKHPRNPKTGEFINK